MIKMEKIDDEKLKELIEKAIKELFNWNGYESADITDEGKIIKYTDRKTYTSNVMVLANVVKNEDDFDLYKFENDFKDEEEALECYAKDYAENLINLLHEAEEYEKYGSDENE